MDIPSISALAGVSIAAAFAALGAFWSQARSFFRYVSGFLLLQKTINGGMIVPTALHIRRRYRKAPSGVSRYVGLLQKIDDRSIASYVPFDMPSQIGLWWGSRGLFLVSATSELTLVSLRWVSDPEGLIVDALNEDYEQRQRATEMGSGNFYVQRVLGTAGDFGALSDATPRKRHDNLATTEDAPSSANSSSGDYWSPDVQVDRSFMYAPERYIQNKKAHGPFHGLFFPEEVHKVVADIQQWFTREDWYRQHGIPWRTGILLHGPGGTGKSSLSRALAQMLGVPLYQFYLNTLTDREFLRAWDEMKAPCVAALEDFDTVFHGRESVTVHRSLSFECVLNAISGISSVNGVLLTVTTNHLDKIDEALGQLDSRGRPTRPGRIDYIVHLGNATVQQRQDIARFTLNGWADDLIEELVAQGADTTAAQFQFMCITAALSRLSAEKASANS